MNLINSHDPLSENEMEKIIEWIIRIEHREANKYENDFIPKNKNITIEAGYNAEFSLVSTSDSIDPDTTSIHQNPSLSNLWENKDRLSENFLEKAELDEPKHNEKDYEEIKDIIMNDMKRVILRNFDR